MDETPEDFEELDVASNSNYELEFCLAHTITILCEYLI